MNHITFAEDGSKLSRNVQENTLKISHQH